MTKAGTWTFINKASGAKTTVKVADSTPSSIKAAFDTANATLSPGRPDLLFGYDPSGREYKYSGVGLGKKFSR